jgi:hypothetical protein
LSLSDGYEPVMNITCYFNININKQDKVKVTFC